MTKSDSGAIFSLQVLNGNVYICIFCYTTSPLGSIFSVREKTSLKLQQTLSSVSNEILVQDSEMAATVRNMSVNVY